VETLILFGLQMTEQPRFIIGNALVLYGVTR
jgi:hypothetical protein